MSARAAAALARASWRTAKSYRFSFALSLLTLAVPIVPVYFIASAMQPFMETVIAGEGRTYFGFVLLGTAVIGVVAPALSATGSAVSGGVSSGFFETLVASPASMGAIVAGQIAYPFFWAVARAVLLVAVGMMLGAELVWSHLPEGLLAAVLVVAAYVGIGLGVGALVVCFRTNAAIPQAFVLLSTLLGGVYFPTTVLPDGLRPVAALVPLTPGLRALRRSLLEGAPLSAVAADLGVAAVMAAIALAGGALAMRWSLSYARRTGSLAQY